jgi:hypothetical protein
LTAGTVLDSTKLPLRTWFLAIYLISQDKTGLSSLALMRHLGTSYRTAWLVHHKLMAAMAECDAPRSRWPATCNSTTPTLVANVPGVGGRGSPNKVPIVAAVQTNDAGRPMRVKVSPVGSFHPRGHRQLGQGQLAARHRRSQRRPEPALPASSTQAARIRLSSSASASLATCPSSPGSTPSWATSRP